MRNTGLTTCISCGDAARYFTNTSSYSLLSTTSIMPIPIKIPMLIHFRRLNMMNSLTDHNVINVRVLLSLMSIILIPHFIRVAFGDQTTSYGLATGALLAALFNIRSPLPFLKFDSTFFLSLTSIVFLILLSSLHSFFVYDNIPNRSFLYYY